ncbi:MAG: DUF4388 domain-containing protein [Candidatus Sericytochromatia bacterium]|nr:DUF4388 domain-containing protein [Candidatus Sericytochromatia bacterium]
MLKEGSLQDFSLPDLLQILVLGKASGTLSMRRDGRTGSLTFVDGQLVQARTGERFGEDVAADLFLWTSGVFDFAEGMPPTAPADVLPLDSITQEGIRRLDRWRQVRESLPSFFSSRAWLHPTQMYQAEPSPLLQTLGSGKTYGDLVKDWAASELELLEELARLYHEDQLGISCAPEEQLRQLFDNVATELFSQFASISGVKMVEGLEARLNEDARLAALGLRWRAGKPQDSLPGNWPKAQLMGAYRSQFHVMSDFISRVYGAAFVERVIQPVLEEATAPQRALWLELTATAPSSSSSGHSGG